MNDRRAVMAKKAEKIVLCMVLSLLCASSCITGNDHMENDALKLLKRSEKKFNDYYKDKPIDLSRMDLSGMTIKKAVLVNADLHSTILTKTKFIRCDLTGANLARAHMDRARFENSTLNKIINATDRQAVIQAMPIGLI